MRSGGSVRALARSRYGGHRASPGRGRELWMAGTCCVVPPGARLSLVVRDAYATSLVAVGADFLRLLSVSGIATGQFMDMIAVCSWRCCGPWLHGAFSRVRDKERRSWIAGPYCRARGSPVRWPIAAAFD